MKALRMSLIHLFWYNNSSITLFEQQKMSISGRSFFISRPIIFVLQMVLLQEMIRFGMAEVKLTAESQAIASPLKELKYADFITKLSGTSFINPSPQEIATQKVTALDSNLGQSKAVMQALQLCDQALGEILSENSWLPRAQLLHDIQQRDLTIILQKAKHDGDEYKAAYVAATETILMNYQPHLSKEMYKKSLLNELMSHLVAKAHRRCRIIPKNPNNMSVFFLRRDGTINPVLKNQLQLAIAKGIELINQMQKLWEKRKEKLSALENDRLIKFLIAVKRYHPSAFRFPAALHKEAGGLDHLIKTGFYQQKGVYLETGPASPASMPYSFGRLEGDYYIFHHTNNIHSSKGKIQAFFIDFQQMQKSMHSPRGPYVHVDENNRLTEMATFIAEFPKPILELFFPDFFTYTEKYLSRCSLLATKNSSRRQAKQPQYEKIPDKPKANKDRPRMGKKPR